MIWLLLLVYWLITAASAARWYYGTLGRIDRHRTGANTDAAIAVFGGLTIGWVVVPCYLIGILAKHTLFRGTH